MHHHDFLFDRTAHNTQCSPRYETHIDHGGRGSDRLFNPRLGRFALGALSTQHTTTNTHKETHTMTTDTHNAIETAIQRAESLGTEHGEGSAEFLAQYLWGGRHTGDSKAAAREFLRMSEDGDPVLWDSYNAPNLSGEYADDMTPGRLMDHCFDTEEDFAECADAEDDICIAYTDAASSAFWGTLERSAAAVLD